MFANKKFFKLALLIIFIFAALNYKMPSMKSTEKDKIKKFEFLDNVKATYEVLTNEPKTSLVPKKEEPLLHVDYGNNVSANSLNIKSKSSSSALSVQAQQSSKNPTTQDSKTIDPADTTKWLEEKIVNVADNLLHTPQGQELLEKFLLNKDPLPANVKPDAKPKDPHHNNSTVNINEGKGKPVQCGDLVTAHYSIRLVSGQEVETTYESDEPLTFQVGNQQVIKGLEYALLGMKVEGRRRVVVPPKLAYNKSKLSRGLIAGNEFVTIDVELLKIDENYQNVADKIRIFNSESDAYNYLYMCSDPIHFKYSITTLDDKLISKSEAPATFILGSNSVPPAINKAFAGIKFKSKRSVIMPSNLLYNKKISFLPEGVKLPKNELILFEIDTN